MLAWIGLGTAANLAQIVSVVPLLGVFGLAYKHFNCVEPGCRWLGHPSRNHRCPKHGALIVGAQEAATLVPPVVRVAQPSPPASGRRMA